MNIKKVFFYAVVFTFIRPLTALSFKTDISFSLTGGTNNTPHVVQKTNEPVLYDFSEQLTEAVEKCSPYRENFTERNPSLKNLGKIFGSSFQIDIDIKGYENDLCSFSVTNSMGALGKMVHTCAITKEQQKEIVSAIKDKSKELVTETFSSVNKIKNEDGSTQESNQTTTITDTRFNIVYAKTMATACEMENVEPTQEDTEKLKAELNALPEEFLAALQNCSEQKAQRNILFFSQTAEIKGMKENKCEIVFDDFTLLLPSDISKTIKNWEDISNLSKDKTFSKFNYKTNYSYDGLMTLIGDCAKSEKCSASSGSSSSTVGNVTKKSGMTLIECTQEGCSFKLLNIISVDGQETDYSIICNIPKTELNKIADEYAPLIEKYGKKSGINENGGIWFQGAKSNDETKSADKKIMLYIQRNRMCRYENRPAL